MAVNRELPISTLLVQAELTGRSRNAGSKDYFYSDGSVM